MCSERRLSPQALVRVIPRGTAIPGQNTITAHQRNGLCPVETIVVLTYSMIICACLKFITDSSPRQSSGQNHSGRPDGSGICRASHLRCPRSLVCSIHRGTVQMSSPLKYKHKKFHSEWYKPSNLHSPKYISSLSSTATVWYCQLKSGFSETTTSHKLFFLPY